MAKRRESDFSLLLSKEKNARSLHWRSSSFPLAFVPPPFPCWLLSLLLLVLLLVASGARPKGHGPKAGCDKHIKACTHRHKSVCSFLSLCAAGRPVACKLAGLRVCSANSFDHCSVVGLRVCSANSFDYCSVVGLRVCSANSFDHCSAADLRVCLANSFDHCSAAGLRVCLANSFDYFTRLLFGRWPALVLWPALRPSLPAGAGQLPGACLAAAAWPTWRITGGFWWSFPWCRA